MRKLTRAEPISALYEQGRVRHAGAFPILETQMAEFTAGGLAGGGSPDRIDAMVWGLSELMIAGDGAAIIEFYRLQAEQVQRGGGQIIEGRARALIRLRAPAGVTHASTISGRSLAVPADRIIEAFEEETPGLCAAGFQKMETTIV